MPGPNRSYKINLQQYKVHMFLILIIITLLIIMFYIRNIKETIDATNNDNLLLYIEKKDNIDRNQIDIKDIKNDGDFMFIYYIANNDSQLLILEQNKFIKNRYSFLGLSVSDNSIGTYYLITSTYTLIVVYGDNTLIKADQYVIDNYTASIKISENISNKDYFLSVYRLSPEFDPINGITLFDKNNNIINWN